MADFREGTPELWAAVGREFVAKFYAMPLRTILDVEIRTFGTAGAGAAGRTTRVALLECGHKGTLYLWLGVGESMRCRDCYEGGLRAAERMIERVGG